MENKSRVWNTPIGRLRLVGIVEGVSYLILLFIAMPLKYLAEMPMMVRITGAIHGGLFIAFCAVLMMAMRPTQWPGKRVGLIFLSSLIPFGTFVIDRGLREEDEKLQASQSSDADPS